MRVTLLCLFVILLFAACDGEGENTADGSDAPDGETVAADTTTDGKALLEERCTVCHNLDRVHAEKTDEAGWNTILDDMVSFGAKLDSAERTTLIAYLVSL
jgi:cytochrome c5